MHDGAPKGHTLRGEGHGTNHVGLSPRHHGFLPSISQEKPVPKWIDDIAASDLEFKIVTRDHPLRIYMAPGL